MTKKNFNKLMHFSDIETAYKNDQYPDAECMLTYPGEVKDNRPFTPAGVNLKPITITENGEYNPADFDADGFSWVDAEIHPTDKLVETITTNGDHDYTGDYKDATITVDVHPTEKLVETITTNGDHDYTGDYKDATITVDVHPTEKLEETLTVDVPYTDIHVVSGPVASFEGEDLPLKSLTASIVPVQAGSGDPSPTNVRPISGWTEEVIGVCGKNWLNSNNLVSGLFADSDFTIIQPSSAVYRSVKFYLKAGTYVFSSSKELRILRSVIDGDYSSQQYDMPFIITVNKDGYVGLSFRNKDDTDWLSNTTLQVEIGSTATTYEPYAGTTTTIPFTDGQGQSVEVFGGSVDVVNGGGSAYKEYDSYNGETLVGPWISDRDVYVPNTSPTIGAQVVDMGDTSTFYTQPTSIKSLDGENNIYANTGDVYVEYQTEWTGESSIVYNAENLLVADVGGQYITNNLDLPLNSGDYYIGELNDITSGDLVPFIIKRDANTSQSIILSLGNDVATLTLTNTTASLSSYGGSYRKIYLRLSEVVDGQLF